MLRASRPVPLLERRGLLCVLAAGLVVVLYAWPMVDGGTAGSFSLVDRLLRLAAVTAVGLACLSGSWQQEGRERAGLLLAAAGAQLWGGVQAVHLVGELLRRSEERAGLDALATVALSGAAAAALWLLRTPVARRHAVRLALEWLLLSVSVLLLLRLALPSFWSAGTLLADAASAAGISLLLAASMLTWARPGSTCRAWPLLPQGLAVVAVGLVASGLPAQIVPLRASGAVLTWGLVLVALAVASGGTPQVPAPTGRARGPAAVGLLLCLLPLAAMAATLPGLFGTQRIEPLALAGVLVLGLLAVAHGHLLSVEARSRARKLSEEELRMRHRAFHDDLTGLPNRALFLDRLTHALDLHRRHRLPMSVLYGDLDGFKQVNDQYGHAAGDALLVAVADRLRQCLRPEDTLARLGGDEFVLLLEHGSAPEAVAARMQQVLLEPFVLAGRPFELRMSIGIARVGAETPSPSPQEVLDRADADMYARKLSERSSRLAPATVPPPPSASSEPELAAALARALHAGEVRVVYQPLVDASTGTVHGMEALARWTHDGRVLLPGTFVELADRYGLSGTLTDVVLDQACAQLGAWSAAAGHHRLTMAVNVTASQMGDPSLAERVRGAVQRHGLEQEQVVVETTVAALSQAGGSTGADAVGLSVAGFTGDPEDFALLSTLPVRSVKMPQQRRSDMAHPDDRLLHVLVALGREIDVRVVVERVERPEELAALRQLSGVLAQGNLLSRPAEAVTLDEIVLRGCALPA